MVYFLLPNIVLRTALPIFFSRPLRVIGMPIAREIFCLILETPSARFQEKDMPGIFIA